MECFFSTVKIELADRFASLSEAKMEFDYIEVFYNQRRRHSTLAARRPMAGDGARWDNPMSFTRRLRLDLPVVSNAPLAETSAEWDNQLIVNCFTLPSGWWPGAPANDTTPVALTRSSLGDYFTATRSVIGS
jgi:hypothetical protein